MNSEDYRQVEWSCLMTGMILLCVGNVFATPVILIGRVFGEVAECQERRGDQQ